MRLVFAGVVTSVALVVSAPSAMAALPQAPAAPAAQSTANAAVGAVQQQAAKGVAAAQQTTSNVQRSAESAVEKAQRIDAPRIEAPRVNPAKVSPSHVAPPRAPAAPTVPRVALPTPPAPAASAIGAAGRETSAYRQKLVPHLSDAQRAKPVGDVLTLVGNALGDTLRQLAPQVGSLLAPVQPLLADLRGDFGPPNLAAVVTPGDARTLGATAERQGVPPARPPTSAPVSGAGAHAAPPHTLQAASARPPAAEVGGRPVSLPPRTAPAPVAGGAAPSSTGGFFVPFLGLLVLAALAAPRLLRRLDELPAFVRPEPFLCALERPG